MYVRIVPQDKERGYVMLVSWSKPVVQRTCEQMSTMGGIITRKAIDNNLERFKKDYSASEVIDLTDEGLKKKFAKLFDQVDAAVVQTPHITNTDDPIDFPK